MNAHRELLRKQLVELDAPPGRMRALSCSAVLLGRRRRMMQKGDAVAKCRQLSSRRAVGRQRVGQIARLERMLDRSAADSPGSGRRWSDRQASAWSAPACPRARRDSADGPSRRRKIPARSRRTSARACPAQAAYLARIEIEKAQHQHRRMSSSTRAHELALGPVFDRVVDDDRLRPARRAPRGASLIGYRRVSSS